VTTFQKVKSKIRKLKLMAANAMSYSMVQQNKDFQNVHPTLFTFKNMNMLRKYINSVRTYMALIPADVCSIYVIVCNDCNKSVVLGYSWLQNLMKRKRTFFHFFKAVLCAFCIKCLYEQKKVSLQKSSMGRKKRIG
jgi:hypothetical protein